MAERAIPKIPVQGRFQSDEKYDREINEFMNRYLQSIESELYRKLPTKYYFRKNTGTTTRKIYRSGILQRFDVENSLPFLPDGFYARSNSSYQHEPNIVPYNYIVTKKNISLNVIFNLRFNTLIKVPGSWIERESNDWIDVRNLKISLDQTRPKLLVNFINSIKRQFSDELYIKSTRVLSESLPRFNEGVRRATETKRLVDELRTIYREALENSNFVRVPLDGDHYDRIFLTSYAKYVDDYLSETRRIMLHDDLFDDNDISTITNRINYELQQITMGRPTSIEIFYKKDEILNKLRDNYLRVTGRLPPINYYREYRRPVEELQAALEYQERQLRALEGQTEVDEQREAESVKLGPRSSYEAPIALDPHDVGTIMVNFNGERNRYKRLYSEEEYRGFPKNSQGRSLNPLTRMPIGATRRYKIGSYAPEPATATVPGSVISAPVSSAIPITRNFTIRNPIVRTPIFESPIVRNPMHRRGGGKTRRRRYH